MLQTLAVANYRSLQELIVPLGPLNLVTGPNGSGKSNLYRALRLLSETAAGGVISSVAREGGLPSVMWAGPEVLSRRMKRGEVPVQGGPRQKASRLRLGFSDGEVGYAISLGLPTPEGGYRRDDQFQPSHFRLDPMIKRESVFLGQSYRHTSAVLERDAGVMKIRDGRGFEVLSANLSPFDSIFSRLADAAAVPMVLALRERIAGWRFYDQLRTDEQAPARQPQLATRTPVLHHDGRDLAAALQTIREIGDGEALDTAVDDAFPGARLEILVQDDNWFRIGLQQPGLLRPLAATELSDGTLRYLFLIAALLSPRPPELVVLNEPETSLHPDLLPALARLIVAACERSQVWVVSHAARLIAALREAPDCEELTLARELGATGVVGLGDLDRPPWKWPDASK